MNVVIGYARRWERAMDQHLQSHPEYELGSTTFTSEGIALDFSTERVFAEPWGDEAPLGSDLRSPYDTHDLDELDYDVLVSLEPLPLVRTDPFRGTGVVSSPNADFEDQVHGMQNITLPFCDLGSYARRIDYGIPTAFLGSPKPLPNGASRSDQLRAFLQSAAGAHTVVHEFGHILGLTHAHQDPVFGEAGFRASREIAQILQTGFELEAPVSERFVREQITQRWPGSPEFSDWLNCGKLTNLRSVMAHPKLSALLVDSKEDPEQAGQEVRALMGKLDKDLTDEERKGFTEPTPQDLDTLLLMYGGIEMRKILFRRFQTDSASSIPELLPSGRRLASYG